MAWKKPGMLSIGAMAPEVCTMGRLDVLRGEGGLGIDCGHPGRQGLVGRGVEEDPGLLPGADAADVPLGDEAIVINLLLIASMPLRQALGELQEKEISRQMGLLLSAIAGQTLVSALRACFSMLK